MAPADPELVDFLERSSDRTLEGLAALTRRVDQVREDLTADRRRDDERISRNDERLGRIEAALDELRGDLERVDERCGALVIEEDVDGQRVVRQRPAALGLDPKFVVGALLTLLSAVATPIIVALLVHA